MFSSSSQVGTILLHTDFATLAGLRGEVPSWEASPQASFGKSCLMWFYSSLHAVLADAALPLRHSMQEGFVLFVLTDLPCATNTILSCCGLLRSWTFIRAHCQTGTLDPQFTQM